ncbi:MAG: hypothetical protein COA94_01640 [Rickettsiales bacterium]|nr:MAG: hypothetical protein COA94_01640 [Rickettsiales bacterium]
MFNFIQKQLDIKIIKTAFVFAVIYCVLFNSPVLIYKFGFYKANMWTAPLEIAKDFIYLVVTLFAFFFGLSVHRVIFIAGAIILFVTGAIASYYLFFFSIAPTLNIMPTIFGTHATEVYELVSLRLVGWVLFSLAVCLYGIRHFNVKTSDSFLTFILSAVCLFYVAGNVTSPKFSFLKTYFPVQYLHNSYVFFFGHSKNLTKEDISLKYSFKDSSDDGVLGVLVIGESARHDRLGINGYERKTTPNLAKMDVVSLKAQSCATSTYYSVPCMLSRLNMKDMDLVDSETTFLSVLTRLGFNTIWLGSQSITKGYRNRKGGSFYYETDFHMIPGGSLVLRPNALDVTLIPYMEQNLDSTKKQFVVLHSTGSHWNYSKRHTKEFAKFTPAIDSSLIKKDAAGCSLEALNNSYDNSILYTDFFLSRVIAKIKDRKSFLIYSSDHGTSLGENGRFLHGGEMHLKEQREVPFIIWFSDKYKAAHPKKWAAVQSLRGKDISHDYLFHSILDCIGIESDAIDKSLSVCKK